ncbi:hypothetical protein ACLK1S_19835 [Escherichia coli]
MQAQFTLLNLVAEGTGKITTKRSLKTALCMCRKLAVPVRTPNRKQYRYLSRCCKNFLAHRLMATDLACISKPVLAGCIAEGTTVVDSDHHIDCGYESHQDKLRFRCKY